MLVNDTEITDVGQLSRCIRPADIEATQSCEWLLGEVSDDRIAGTERAMLRYRRDLRA